MTVEHQPPPADARIRVGGIDFTHDDLFRVVGDFYARVEHDPILKVPFRTVHDWPEHVRKLTHFWWIRFGGRPYMPISYDPVTKHFLAGFDREFLARWLTLFHDTLRTHLTAEQAALWKLVSERMGDALSMKNEYFKREQEEGGGDQ